MLLMGKSTISIAIFNSYVSLPEDNYIMMSVTELLERAMERDIYNI